MQSSRELYENQIKIEAEEIANSPEEEQEELALIYQSKGLPEDRARELAAHMMADKDSILDTLAREELGIDPEELGGSAYEAAFTSFFLFAVGAVFPIFPFFFEREFCHLHEHGHQRHRSLHHWRSHYVDDAAFYFQEQDKYWSG
ncbi:MAG: VIT1/CCC1 transporter family protein [Anaerolineales bacterium]|nr:VIT1/CCC1 transporter family protein [Anaerolineales bacterium]